MGSNDPSIFADNGNELPAEIGFFEKAMSF
jgi:hypothetical protein